MHRGIFITIYGVNNIGKSTHAKRLVERLKNEGHPAVYIKYPVYDCEPTGSQLDKILRSSEGQSIPEKDLQELFVQNRKDYEPTLRKILDEGTIVVAEDYVGTGIAWGTAKGLDKKWLEEINEGLLKEDFSILMVGQRAHSAIEEHHIHESNDELIAKVAAVLDELADENGWVRVEVQPEKDDTAKLVYEAAKVVLITD